MKKAASLTVCVLFTEGIVARKLVRWVGERDVVQELNFQWLFLFRSA